jgi:alkaline phosphatase D
MNGPTRRDFLRAATLAALIASPEDAWAALNRRPGVGFGRFRDGVAAGDPSATGITFWSRLRTDNPRSGARLVVARDPGLRKVVATRLVPTGSGVNWTLKARVGGLKPHTRYYYVWHSGNDVSPVGRARTLPPPDSDMPLLLGFSSCQHYGHGYFSSHLDAAHQDLDLYVFLGDYIYAERLEPLAGVARSDNRDANDLRSYRGKYQRYRADSALRELHRLHACVHIWDDHEIENNYTDNRPAPSAMQRAAGYRAAFEWLPRQVLASDRFRVYKKLALGRTADLFLLDERQYRTVDAGDKPLRLLGDQQLSWLLGGLAASKARWKIVANQVPIAPLDYGNGQRADSWGGYDASRAQLLGELERAGIRDVVFLTGDAHVFMLNLLASDPEAFRGEPAHPPAAIEYVAGSVTSPGPLRTEPQVQAGNPWNRQYNAEAHGYALIRMDAGGMTTEYRRADLSRPDGGSYPFERFVQASGANAVTRESLAPPPPPV